MCDLDYIPSHLHWNSKPLLNKFYPEEILYRRVNPNENIDLPFATISLYDISFNRSGISNNMLCEREDVLWNVDPEKDIEKYNLEISEIIVKKLNLEVKDEKVIRLGKEESINENDLNIFIILKLTHKPIDCNYSHSTIVFSVEGKIVDNVNYEYTLGSKKYKRLIIKCRKILNDAILKKEISF